MQIRVPTNFEGREFDKSLKLLKSTPKMGQFLGHFCLQSENESLTRPKNIRQLGGPVQSLTGHLFKVMGLQSQPVGHNLGRFMV